jgi:type IV fimbrial biogenesis protein FimT
MTGYRKNNGFTLIELMIVLVVMAILLSLAAPSFIDVIRNNRIQTTADDFFTSLVITRNEALKRNQAVVICKTGDGVNCTTAGSWEQGWLIYADVDSDGSKDAGEPVIHVNNTFPTGYTLKAAGSSDLMAYRPDGSPSGFDTFVLCDGDEDLNRAREIIVNIVGRPRLKKTTNDCDP